MTKIFSLTAAAVLSVMTLLPSESAAQNMGYCYNKSKGAYDQVCLDRQDAASHRRAKRNAKRLNTYNSYNSGRFQPIILPPRRGLTVTRGMR